MSQMESYPSPPIIMRSNETEREMCRWYKNERNHKKATTSITVRELVLEWSRLHPKSRIAFVANQILSREGTIPAAPPLLLAAVKETP